MKKIIYVVGAIIVIGIMIFLNVKGEDKEYDEIISESTIKEEKNIIKTIKVHIAGSVLNPRIN